MAAKIMVSVAQLVEPRVVIPVVVGSSPIVHPIYFFVSTLVPPFRGPGSIVDVIPAGCK